MKQFARNHEQSSFQFGVFELDPHSGELRKHGIKLKLQHQPLQILGILLERPGEVVTREEIQKRLWPDNTYVDFDNAINSAVRKLRDALGDTAENPRFIETLARRGYRFIYPISGGVPLLPVELRKASGKQHRIGLAALFVSAALAVAAGLWIANSGNEVTGAPAAPVPLTSYPGFEQFPSFSPDGSRVAFSWDEPGKRSSNIYVKPIGPGDPVRLTASQSGDFGPAWSPDGRFIAFLRARDPLHASVMVMTAVGGQERELAHIVFESGIIFSHYHWDVPPPFLAWSADGKWLLTSDQTGSGSGRAHAIVCISLDTGDKHPLTSPRPDTNGDGSIAVSPDGKTLAFTRTTAIGVSDIFIAPLSRDLLADGAVRLTFDGREIEGLAWAPDGRNLVFSSARGGRLELWRIFAKQGSRPIRLNAAGDDPGDLAISRQARRLVYRHVVGGVNIARVSINGKQAGEAVDFLPSTRLEGHPKYSPDGRRIAFESNRSGSEEIWTCNADGTNAIQLTSFGNAWAGSPRWSPDGQKIAFDSNAAGNWDIYVINSQGGKPLRLTTSSASEYKPSWSSDGKWIYFCSNRTGAHQVWKISPIGGKQIQVTRNGGDAAFESLDGKTLYYEKGLGLGLWEMPTQGGSEVRISESMYLRNFAPAKEGVYLIDRDDHLKLFDFKTHAINTIALVPGPIGAEMSISPDERWMLYESPERASELMLVENFR